LNLLPKYLAAALFLIFSLPAFAAGHGVQSPQCPDSTPSYATSAGYTTCTFYSSFPNLNRIDVFNTAGPSQNFDWFVASSYNEGAPNEYGNIITAASWASTSGGQATFTTISAHGLSVGATIVVQDATPTGYNGTYTTITGTTGSTVVVALASNPGSYVSGATMLGTPGALSTNGTYLTVNQAGRNSGNANNAGLSTYYKNIYNSGTISPSSHGRLFYNGFLVRYTYAVPSSMITGNSPEFPALWMINWANHYSWYCENDTVEMRYAGTATTAFTNRYHDNWNPVYPDENDDTILGPGSSNLGNPTWDGAHFYTTDVLWVPSFKGSGTGSFTEYFQGSVILGSSSNSTVQSYSQTGAPNPVLSPSSPNGSLGICDQGGFNLYLNGGWADSGSSVPWPIYVVSVQVWQALPTDMQVN
jgi:hypothetical protein